MKLSGKKFNILDVIVVLLLVAVLAFAAWRLFGKDEGIGGTTQVSKPNIRFTVLCDDLDPTLAEHLTQMLEGGEMTVGGSTVERTRLYNSNKLVDARVTAHEIVENENGTSDLLLTVEANATVTPGAYSVVTQEVRVGKEYKVKTVGIEIDGVILSLEQLG